MEKYYSTSATYPYGDIYRTYTLGGYADQKYDFTGKERDVETGLHYFSVGPCGGARYYDSDLGRWLQVDPLADKYPGWSPYNYCVNNPLIVVDPDGMAAEYKDELSSESDGGDEDKDKKNANCHATKNGPQNKPTKQQEIHSMSQTLGNISDAVSTVGTIVGTGLAVAASVAVTVEAAPVVLTAAGVAFTVSTVADATSTGAKYVDYKNGTGSFEAFGNKLSETVISWGGGKFVKGFSSKFPLAKSVAKEIKIMTNSALKVAETTSAEVGKKIYNFLSPCNSGK